MATRDRENQFPATSIGRTSGARLQQTVTVQESHPLGAPLPPTSNEYTSGNGSGNFAHAKYRPYTPRHRVAPTVTTGTIVHPPSPQHHPAGGGNATSKLQLTNAKAVAQNVGLDTGSVGWAILEKVVLESETGELWAEIWSAITGGKATVLLPTEQLSSHDKLTPEFLKDHIALYDSSQCRNAPAPIITLSGLRGTLHGNTITFHSTLHPSSQLFTDLLDSTTRSSVLRKLPPLPFGELPCPHQAYPSVKVSITDATLPLPPRAPVPPKPPLPPRPGARPISTSSATSGTPSSSSSRIPNPFASLFGNRPSTPTPPVAASPPASVRSLEPPASITGTDSHTIVEVSAIIIERKILRKDVGKQLNKALRCEIRESLRTTKDADVPHWVVERVSEFCDPWFPFVRAPKTMSIKPKGANDMPVKEKERDKDKDKEKEWVVNPIANEESLEDTAERVQEFYTQLEEGLRVELSKATRTHERETSSDVASVENEKDTGEKVEDENEARIREVMELAERTVCSLFYDRLFMQPSTDDASHDEALSNRVAALNVLDLSLEHLDIEVGEAGSRVDDIIKACGEKLYELDTSRAPKDKATILVEAHQIVVDGLSRLPPVRLMSPEESKALRGKHTAGPKSANASERGTQDSGKPSLSIDVPPPLPQWPSTSGQPSPTVSTMTAATATSTTLETERDVPKAVSDDSSTTTKASLAATGVGRVVQQAELSPLSLATTSTLPSQSPTPSAPSSPSVTYQTLPPTQTEIHTQAKTQVAPTPVSSDILLPMIIFSVVKSNPPHLVSNLLYIQRFRNRNAHMHGGGGEESFCLINVLAVAEFLENVDMEALGLGSGAVSASELTPIITRSPAMPNAPVPVTLTPRSAGTPLLGGIDGLPHALRGKVEQQVDAIAGSANKVFSGVVDSSFGILRSLLPHHPNHPNHPEHNLTSHETVLGAGGSRATPTTAKPGFGLLRREAGFSIASIAASLPISSRGKGSQSQAGEEGQQLVTVSRPGSVKSFRSGRSSMRGLVGEDESDEDEGSEEDDGSGEEEEEDESGEEGSVDESDEGGSDDEGRGIEGRGVDIPGIRVGDTSSVTGGMGTGAGSFGADARSIRSFESMMSDSKKRQKEKKKKQRQKAVKAASGKNTGVFKNVSASAAKVVGAPRKSLSDRLASVSALAGGLKGSPPDSRRSSLLQPPVTAPVPAPAPTGTLPYTRHVGSPASSRATSPSLSRSPSPLPIRAASPFLVSPPSMGNTSVHRLPPPNQRFMECSVEELRISEVVELLREYRRLVEGVRAMGGFEE